MVDRSSNLRGEAVSRASRAPSDQTKCTIPSSVPIGFTGTGRKRATTDYFLSKEAEGERNTVFKTTSAGNCFLHAARGTTKARKSARIGQVDRPDNPTSLCGLRRNCTDSYVAQNLQDLLLLACFHFKASGSRRVRGEYRCGSRGR